MLPEATPEGRNRCSRWRRARGSAGSRLRNQRGTWIVTLNHNSWKTFHQILEQITSGRLWKGNVVGLGQEHGQLVVGGAQAPKQAASAGWSLSLNLLVLLPLAPLAQKEVEQVSWYCCLLQLALAVFCFVFSLLPYLVPPVSRSRTVAGA